MPLALSDSGSPMAPANPAVACLRLHHNAHAAERDLLIDIYPNVEFDVGRADIEAAWDVDDPTISAHHVRIRCVVYDDDHDEHPVPEMVYIRLLSTNQALFFPKSATDTQRGQVVTKMAGDILLSSGDRLQLSSSISATFLSREPRMPGQMEFTAAQKHEMSTFADRFRITDRVLGIGGHASVVMAVKRHTARQIACKIVPTHKAEGESFAVRDNAAGNRPRPKEIRKYLAREFNILQSLDHPNIIRLEKVFEGTHNIYIFQELIAGGDLLSYLDRRGALGEPQTVAMVRQILEAVNYLHTNDVVHRDIKPENILLTSWRDGARLVLTDFGQARDISSVKTKSKTVAIGRMQSIVGTRGYTAPEIIRLLNSGSEDDRGYGKAIDIWSIGCVTAILLTNNSMFDDQGRSQLDSQPDWDVNHAMNQDPVWEDIGKNAKSFVRSCLAASEENRLTSEDALGHRWVRHPSYQAEVDEVYQRAVCSWKPREHEENVVESVRAIPSINILSPSNADEETLPDIAESMKSSYFESLPQAPPHWASSHISQDSKPPRSRKHTILPRLGDEIAHDQSRSRKLSRTTRRTTEDVRSRSAIRGVDTPANTSLLNRLGQKGSTMLSHTLPPPPGIYGIGASSHGGLDMQRPLPPRTALPSVSGRTLPSVRGMRR